MPESGFFKRFDRYSKPIGLTYKQKGTFETSAGGICSIITFFIFATWLSLEVVDVYLPPGKFTATSGMSLTQAEDGSFPAYNITQDQLNIIYKATTKTGSALSMEDVDKYITGMWIQVSANTSHEDPHKGNETYKKYYPSKPCTEGFNETDHSRQFMDQIQGMNCPNFGNETNWHLQLGDHNEDLINDNTFFFVIDSCEHFSKITKKTDCKTQAQTDEMLPELIIHMKVFTQFFSVKTYIANNYKLNSDIKTQGIQLSPIAYNRITYSVEQTKVSFKDSYIYNFASLGGISETVYSVIYSMSYVFLPTTRDMTTMSPYDSPLSIQFVQS